MTVADGRSVAELASAEHYMMAAKAALFGDMHKRTKRLRARVGPAVYNPRHPHIAARIQESS